MNLDEFIAEGERILRMKARDLEAANQYRVYVDMFTESGGTLPHCDPRVLHSQGSCRYCDGASVLQLMRKNLGLKFTDELEPDSPLLPGEDRSRQSAERWGGNR